MSVLRGMQKDGVNILGRELFRVKVDIPPLSPVCLLEVRWRGPIFSLPFSLFLKSRPPAPPKSRKMGSWLVPVANFRAFAALKQLKLLNGYEGIKAKTTKIT
jgi:hypothetical protein